MPSQSVAQALTLLEHHVLQEIEPLFHLVDGHALGPGIVVGPFIMLPPRDLLKVRPSADLLTNAHRWREALVERPKTRRAGVGYFIPELPDFDSF